MRLRDIGEWALIERIREFAGAEGLGLFDDCAVLEPPPGRLLVSTDAMVEGVHFDAALMSWHDVGYRALAGALSDLAASGGERPARYLVALGLPGEFLVEDAVAIYRGMHLCAERAGAQLAGGDTVEAPVAVLGLTVLAPVERPLLRSGAREGDLVFASGTLGRSARGLELLRAGGAGPEIEAFLHPLPRLALGSALAHLGATACADVSDGLYPELKAIAEASGVGIEVAEGDLPVCDKIPRSLALRYAYGGGEDYELVFTAPPDLAADVLRLRAEHGPIACIGVVRPRAQGLTVRRDGASEPLAASGYTHFARGEA